MPRLRLRTLLRRLTHKLISKTLRPRTKHKHATGPAGSNFCKLPAELLFAICSLLSLRDVRNLGLTSSGVRLTVLPVLFRVIHVENQETFNALLSCPNITRHLQEFKITCLSKYSQRRRTWISSSGQDHERVERIMSEKMVSAAHTGALRLHFLRRLEWNAITAPADIFWRVVSTSCPCLKEIAIQVDEPPKGQSSLWKLKRLTSFSLTIWDPKAGAKEGLSPAMWEMLVTHCPDLRYLAIQGAEGSSLDCTPAFRGRWASLQRLAVSSGVYNDELVHFLRFHTKLQHLDIAWIGTEEHRTSTEATEQQASKQIPLPVLRTFVGNIHFASKIISSPEDIRILDVSYTLLLPRLLPSLRPFLSSFTFLTSLAIGLRFEGTQDSVSIFSVLAASCAHLTFFHVICIPVLPMHRLEELASELQCLPFLRILQLSEQKYGRYDELMSDTAGRIALNNPQLTEVRIVWITTPLSKEQYTQFGTYHVVLNERGDPARLLANEVQTRRRSSKRRWRQFRYNITARRALWETTSTSVGSSIIYGLPGFMI